MLLYFHINIFIFCILQDEATEMIAPVIVNKKASGRRKGRLPLKNKKKNVTESASSAKMRRKSAIEADHKITKIEADTQSKYAILVLL